MMVRHVFGSIRLGSILAACAAITIACNTGNAGNQGGGESTGGDGTGDSTGEGEEDDGAADLTGLVCDTDGIAGGGWETGEVEDWSNPGEGGLEIADFPGVVSDPIDAAGIDRVFASKPGLDCDIAGSFGDLYGTVDSSIAAHHCYTTAVHAVHVQTQDAREGAMLVMHGENDQRLWDIGSPPDEMTWHPVAVRTEWEEVDEDNGVETWARRCNLPDLFCSGHVQLYNGQVFVAGGNVTGSPSGGAINDTYLFDPVAAQGLGAPQAGPFGSNDAYGWLFESAGQAGYWQSESPAADYDRWYPTLTALPDGRVLIAGGDSRAEWHANPDPEQVEARATRVLEVYDPTAPIREQQIRQLPGGNDALFPIGGVPQYPFMFVLPNGDVFYAGSESPDAGQEQGQILVVDYDKSEQAEWFWLELEQGGIQSTISGGSAVMYRPGRVLKTGGRSLSGDGQAAVAVAEVIDLTGYAAGARPTPANREPEVAPPSEFSEASAMNFARHYHTLTMLPDGRVLATGGNRWGNSSTDGSENYHNPCDILGTRIDDIPCDEGCPSVCTPRLIEVGDPNPENDEDACLPANQVTRCSLIEAVRCRDEEECAEIDDDPGTPEDECNEAFGCVRVGSACVSSFEYECDDVLSDSYCDGTRCRRDCTEQEQGSVCGLVMPVNGECLVEAAPLADAGMCSPQNNACHATYDAEIWDPECDVWTPLPPQAHPRMYHSTALLLPDARVISMGGGHRGVGNPFLEEQVISEYFAPTYSGGGDVPAFDEPANQDAVEVQSLEYPLGPLDEVGTVLLADPDVEIDHVALVKLGSVTHGFDMGQSYMRLGIGTGNVGTIGTLFETNGLGFPFDRNSAPPGHYMMFLVTPEGEPSQARYVRLGATAPAGYYCEPSEAFAATETVCTQEPISGTCPSGGIQAVNLAPPSVGRSTGGPSPGFMVVTSAGLVDDPASLSSAEADAVQQLCATACEQHYAAHPGQTANCTAPGAFEAPQLESQPERGALDLIHSTHRAGEGLFGTSALSCDLGDDCYLAFDEPLRPVAHDRVTPASAPLGYGEEWRLTVAGEMSAWASSGGNPVTADLVGSIGYAQCADGNTNGPCPFYLGSMEFSLTDDLVLPMQCGSSLVTHALTDLTVRLDQPAFGMAEEGTAWKGFTPGAIVIDAEGEVDGIPFHVRRANQEPLFLRAGQAWTLLQGTDGAWLEFAVPCDGEMADVLVWWGYSGVGVEDSPPTVSINVPASVPCPSTGPLSKSVTDADSDLESVRWFVDGVLMADAISSMTISAPHTLRLVARDARGATVTATKAVSCQ